MKNKLNQFIESQINVYEDSISNIKELEKLSFYIKKENLKLDIDDYIYLVNSNKKILLIIKNIIVENINILNEFGIKFITDNEIIYNLINCCAIEQKIKFSKREKEFSPDLYVDSMLESYIKGLPDTILNKSEEKILFLKIKEGNEEAKNFLIQMNLKLVVNIARKYQNYGIPILDLIQEGNIGIIEAINRFEIERDLKFSTYAVHWIKKCMMDNIRTMSKCVCMTPTNYSNMIKCVRSIPNFNQKSIDKINIDKLAIDLNLSVTEISRLLLVLNEHVSLEESVKSTYDAFDKCVTVGDFIQDTSESIEDKVITRFLQVELNKIFADMDERNVEIFKLRRGFYNGIQYNQEFIAKKFNISVQRVGQIEEIVIKRILNTDSLSNLAYYMSNPKKAQEFLEKNKNNRSFHRQLKVKNIKKETK